MSADPGGREPRDLPDALEHATRAVEAELTSAAHGGEMVIYDANRWQIARNCVTATIDTLRAAALSGGREPRDPPDAPHPLDVVGLARLAAKKHQYALAIHGSMARDIDLIAVPWHEDASEPAVLVEAIRRAVDGTIFVAEPNGREGYYGIDDETKHSPVERAHGRLAWSIYGVLGGSYIDLSVMPRAAALSGGAPEEDMGKGPFDCVGCGHAWLVHSDDDKGPCGFRGCECEAFVHRTPDNCQHKRRTLTGWCHDCGASPSKSAALSGGGPPGGPSPDAALADRDRLWCEALRPEGDRVVDRIVARYQALRGAQPASPDEKSKAAKPDLSPSQLAHLNRLAGVGEPLETIIRAIDGGCGPLERLSLIEQAVRRWQAGAQPASQPPTAISREASLLHALEFAQGAVEDAIYSDDGLDGATGDEVLTLIKEVVAGRVVRDEHADLGIEHNHSAGSLYCPHPQCNSERAAAPPSEQLPAGAPLWGELREAARRVLEAWDHPMPGLGPSGLTLAIGALRDIVARLDGGQPPTEEE